MDGNSTHVLEIIRQIYNVDQLLSGKEYIKEIVSRLSKALNVNYVMVGHGVEPDLQSVQTDFLYSHGQFIDNVVYSLVGTPCTDVICGTRVSCYSAKVQEKFPQDQMLKDLNVQSYMGAPFLHTDGGLMGLLVIMDDKPFVDIDLSTAVVEFFAARIGAEYRRMAVEENLRRSNEDLEKLVEVRTKQLLSQEKLATLGRITLGIAHELKNPLNVIITASEILRDAELSESDRERTIEMINQYGVRANDIITNMLKQARQDVDSSPVWVDLSHLLKHTFDVYLKSLSDIDLKTKLNKKINIAPNVKAYLTDAPGVERAFINIIDNAVYALGDKMRKLGPAFKPELEVELTIANKSGRIRVRDNGVGISEKNLKKVCDEFYTTKPPGDGSGLGLWVVKQNIDKNNGSMKIESREHEYTELTIEIPASQKSAEVSL